MKIALILPACLLLCTAEPPLFPYKAFPKDAQYPISFQERAEPAGPTSETGTGWGWKNKELKQIDEGWGADKQTETTAIPLILIPSEPEDSTEPVIIITNAAKTRGADEDDHDSTLHIFGGDAEKAKAVDWGSEGYKQLKTAKTFESWKMSSTDAAFLEEDSTISPQIEADNEGALKATKAGPSKGWGKGSPKAQKAAKAQKASISYEAKAGHVKAQKAHHAKATKGDGYELKAQEGDDYELKAQKGDDYELKAQKGDDYELKAQKGRQIKAQKAQDYEFKAHHKAANKAGAEKAAAAAAVFHAKALKAAAQKKGKKAEGVAKASEDYHVEAIYFKDY